MLKHPAALLLFSLILTACSKYNTDLNKLPTWDSDWILPLIKGKVAFENIKELSESKINFDVPSIDIGYSTGVNVNVPPLNIPAVGPYKQPLSDWISLVHFDTLQIKLSFTNAFPISIGTGTQFAFRRTANASDPGNLIYKHSIANDIASNGTYDFDITIRDNSLSDTVYIFLEQFQSPGGNNVVFSTNTSRITVQLKILNVIKVDLHAAKSLVEKDTLALDFGNDDKQDDTTASGKINFFVENAIPINFAIQFYFLDPVSSQITDSLFSSPFQTTGCNTNTAGDPIDTKSTQTSVSIHFDRIRKIQNSKKGIISYTINTLGYPPPFVYLSKKAFLKMQLTGDLHLSFNLNSI